MSDTLLVSRFIDAGSALFASVHGALFENLVQPLLFALGLMHLAEPAFDAVEWFLIGLLEVVLLVAVLGSLERRWPAEPLVDRSAMRTDSLYTLLHRLGAVPLLAFALFTPLIDAIETQLRLMGLSRPNLDQLWPGVTDIGWVSFLIYLVILDLFDYAMHRGQHAWRWWWALHAVHHSQRQMTFWSDNRNHLLDDLIRDAVLAGAALAIGVAPAQFVALIVASRVLQSLQHANLRWRWGGLAERMLVSPSFHRRHHAIGYGHEGPAKGCNFAVLFPVWDLIFRTADWRPGFVPTGIADQLDGQDYGRGFWSQQRLGLQRLLRALPGGRNGSSGASSRASRMASKP
jgi:sterol desaturase/sphingolipid hydroxylase (fatty acid hydroxylase superfamily)